MSAAIMAHCSNCGSLTPATAMLRDPSDGSLHCTTCPGEHWLRRTYGERAAAELVALREHRPGAPTLADLVATYPEPRGFGVREPGTHCRQGHRYTPETTYVRPDGARQCRTCRDAARRPRQVVAR